MLDAEELNEIKVNIRAKLIIKNLFASMLIFLFLLCDGIFIMNAKLHNHHAVAALAQQGGAN
ncbi:hypothetical protein TUM3794_34070 [Shewanella colwelliana]|uniref:Uncharacterized protein n=1 Tax=Shewanella colwelliana TaxID=23 RepID=A0ABQ4PBS9_SHECO|nr:hypothetical protein TUM3794_34070 [Shewanella colwelliana]